MVASWIEWCGVAGMVMWSMVGVVWNLEHGVEFGFIIGKGVYVGYRYRQLFISRLI